MKKIIIHWTAGGAVPTEYEKQFYHFLVDYSGKIHCGKFKPEANLKCVKGMYAAHTGGGNTGAIGVSMCGMVGFKDKKAVGIAPITRLKFERTMEFCAGLAQKYGIDIT